MTSFSGVIRLADEPDATILADMDVFEDRLVLSAAGAEIGSWPRNGLAIETTNRGFSVMADGEGIILEPSDLASFAGAMGLEIMAIPDEALIRLEPGTLLSATPNDDVDPRWVREQAKTLGPLRARSAAEWAESDRIGHPVKLAIGGSIVLTILAVVLGWGDGSLLDDFPVERVLFALIAIALIAALYMATSTTQERQIIGFAVVGAGVIGLIVLWIWGRTTGVAIGYLVGAVAATVAIVGGALAAADWPWVVFPARENADEPSKKARPSRLGRLGGLLRRR